MKSLSDMSTDEFFAAAAQMTKKERKAAIKSLRAEKKLNVGELRRLDGEIEGARFTRMWTRIQMLMLAKPKDETLLDDIDWFLAKFRQYLDKEASENKRQGEGRKSGTQSMKERGKHTKKEVERLYPKAKYKNVPEDQIPQWIHEHFMPQQFERGKVPWKPAVGTIKNTIAVLKVEKRI
jgi:hypothetical protein